MSFIFTLRSYLTALFICAGLSAQALPENTLLASYPAAADFILAEGNRIAPIMIESDAPGSVARAAADLCADIESVTSRKPHLIRDTPTAETLVLIAVTGKSKLLDDLSRRGKIDLAALRDQWEAGIIQVIENPWPGVKRALVIAGSDPRGAIYATYDISQAIGVSPWYWWADVPPKKSTTLVIRAGTHARPSPSVKYRGIFLNDEGWALQPWAAKTFDPELGDIGPKTYAKIFELVMRLRGNLVWPAMHPCTHAFNHYERNKEVADEYGIVMGSSHAEPMLRNNLDEWKAPEDDYNYITNREGVLSYWEKRVTENGRCENIYTLGMRGIHDSSMVGPKTTAERITALEKIFADQRDLLRRHVNPHVEHIPQMFCVYKEVLELYRAGLRVPDDVTIVWPDDNFGYIRNFATAAERKRSGGFGVYYHLSYLGRPLSYLWLCTTPPSLVWEEMHKAYEHGADRIWIVNVGDLKPAEHMTEFFLQMAWDINRWNPNNLDRFLPEWAAREFGSEHADEIAAIMAEYYRLNFLRKPEHLQWWLPRTPRQTNPLTDGEVQTRLEAFAALERRTVAFRAKIPQSHQDAFYQIVHYPVVGSALANRRFFEGERGNFAAAHAADKQLAAETHYFNNDLSAGKWRHYMALEPADKQWVSMRIEKWTPPEKTRAPIPDPKPGTRITLNAAHFFASTARHPYAWTVIPGLGRDGDSISVLPTTFEPFAIDKLAETAPRVEYPIHLPAAGDYEVQLTLLPVHPIIPGTLRFALGLDADAPQIIAVPPCDGGPEWSQAVLNASRTITTKITTTRSGAHTLRLYAIDPGLVVEKITINLKK